MANSLADREELFDSLVSVIEQYCEDYKLSELDKIDFYTISAFCTMNDLSNVVNNMKYFLCQNHNLPSFLDHVRSDMIMYLYTNSLSTCIKQSMICVEEKDEMLPASELFSDLIESDGSNVRCQCGSTNVSQFTQQGRTSDEAPNLYIRCHDCGQIKRIN